MTNYTIEITDDLARAEVRINAYEILGTHHKTVAKILEGWAKPFASLSLNEEDCDYLFEEGENPNIILASQDFFDNFEGAYITERIQEFFGSLDFYAKQEAEQNKPTWACAKCGATTSEPAHKMITYFHEGCKG